MDAQPKIRGAVGWFLQRVTGLFLAVFLIIHLQVLHYTDQWRLNFDVITTRLESSNWWVVFYIIFIPACLFHALNGTWGIIHDYRPNPGTQTGLKLVLWVIGLAFCVYGYFAISPLL